MQKQAERYSNDCVCRSRNGVDPVHEVRFRLELGEFCVSMCDAIESLRVYFSKGDHGILILVWRVPQVIQNWARMRAATAAVMK